MSGYKTCRECGERRRRESFGTNTSRYKRRDGTVTISVTPKRVCNQCRSQQSSAQQRIKKICKRNREIVRLYSWPPPRLH